MESYNIDVLNDRPYSDGIGDHRGHNVFQWTKDDKKAAPSIEDIAFLNIMKLGAEKDRKNNWVSRLLFKYS